MPQALAGVRVLDFTHVLSGPVATHLLALHGAEVVKIESAEGDAMRHYGGAGPSPAGEAAGASPSFRSFNAGKRSVVLDLKDPRHLAVAKRLVATADVVVENFRAGVMDRLGLGPAACQALRPGIVFCSISGFGQTGPLRHNAALDQIIQSVSGLMTLSGEPESPSMRVGFPLVDTFTGTTAALAIVMALLRRERSGEGQVVDVAMLDAAMAMMVSVAGPFLLAGVRPTKTGNLGYSRSATADTFPTGDGELTLGVTRQDQFATLCRAIGRNDLLVDPRFDDKWLRQRNREPLRAELVATFATRSALDWERALTAAGLAAAAVRDLPDALALPHLRERQAVLPVDGDANAAPAVVNAGFLFAEDGAAVRSPAPALGAHTREVLAELGLGDAEIEALLAPPTTTPAATTASKETTP